MAAISVVLSTSCADTQGRLTLDSVSDAPGSSPYQSLTWTVVNQTTGTDYGGVVSQGDILGVPDGTYTVRITATYADGTTARSTPGTCTISCAGNTQPTPTPTPPAPTQIYGCTTARALNYNAQATQDTDPTTCVFVQLPTLPDLVAAHLPIQLLLRASPSASGYASIVRLHLLTAAVLAGPWVEVAQLRQRCDDTATAYFDLSETAKSLLRILPPVEGGVDANLSALLQVTYEVLDPDTLTTTSQGTIGTCRVLNATVQPVAGAALVTPCPYVSMPVAAALWTASATLAGGVQVVAAPLPTDGCKPRQFVWLNAAGAWDSGFFYGRHVHGVDQADALTYRDAARVERYADRGTVRPTLQVYSDKLDFATYLAIRGIRNSVQVYERVAVGQYVPVLLSSASFTEYQEQTDKYFNVDFTVSYPALLLQTQ